MDRYLSYIIQERRPVGSLILNSDPQRLPWNHYSKLIPMKQMWSVFANNIERMKKIHSSQPGLNSFNAAFLEGGEEPFQQAVVIFGTQALLMMLTISHIWENRED